MEDDLRPEYNLAELKSSRKHQIRRECGLLAREAAKLIGAAAWYEQANKVLTDEEKRAVRQLWDTLPGNTSWTDAFLLWMKE